MALPHIAVLGAGIFVRTQYIPRLRELSDSVVLKVIWSRTEESARAAAKLAQDFSPNIECKWGDAGPWMTSSMMRAILGVAVVLAGQAQVDVSLRMLKGGKNVIQANSEAEAAISSYRTFCNQFSCQPIWAVAENYRFEQAFAEAQKLVNDVGNL